MQVPADNGQPPTVQSVAVERRRGFGFDEQVVVTVVTVILAEFGKALLGDLAKATWDYVANRLRLVKAKGPIVVVYQGRAFSGIDVDVILRYVSSKALREDQNQHSIYLAIAAAYLSAQVPDSHISISLMDLLPADMLNKPQDFIVRRSNDDYL